MVKHIKTESGSSNGKYLITKDQLKELIAKYERNEMVEYNGKLYYCIEIKPKSKEIKHQTFLEVILNPKLLRKKAFIIALETTAFKFSKYCISVYGTDDIKKIIQLEKDRLSKKEIDPGQLFDNRVIDSFN